MATMAYIEGDMLLSCSNTTVSVGGYRKGVEAVYVNRSSQNDEIYEWLQIHTVSLYSTYIF